MPMTHNSHNVLQPLIGHFESLSVETYLLANSTSSLEMFSIHVGTC